MGIRKYTFQLMGPHSQFIESNENENSTYHNVQNTAQISLKSEAHSYEYPNLEIRVVTNK